jgi:3-hydroxyacyl-CoA dehydrogenase
MTETRILLDPTAELAPPQREPVPRPVSLNGLTVGLLDISKARGDVFLDRIEENLKERGLATRRYKKPTFARVAPTELQLQIATECDVVIEALAD